ncbi:hypothetical protein M436DRAFT_58242 [Aureobasidium namibiae CBS 147.97]|uniref:Uncharacterized protein n=1 Tax=Aureobasidium namibiae CBS 147.97 TaxID=1043004 RepID=A0A074W6P5_9PEZI
MAQTSKRILIAGLGRHVAVSYEVGPRLGIQKTNRQIVLDEIDKARAAGYECSSMDVNPEQPEESINQIKKMLTEQRQDLFIIGFGLRGNATLTALFEKAVNVCVALSPSTKLGFAPAPNEMYKTILRVLSEK